MRNFGLTIRMNGARDEVTVETEHGTQKIDRSAMRGDTRDDLAKWCADQFVRALVTD